MGKLLLQSGWSACAARDSHLHTHTNAQRDSAAACWPLCVLFSLGGECEVGFSTGLEQHALVRVYATESRMQIFRTHVCFAAKICTKYARVYLYLCLCFCVCVRMHIMRLACACVSQRSGRVRCVCVHTVNAHIQLCTTVLWVYLCPLCGRCCRSSACPLPRL